MLLHAWSILLPSLCPESYQTGAETEKDCTPLLEGPPAACYHCRILESGPAAQRVVRPETRLTIPEGLPANGIQVSVAVDEAFTHLVVEEWLEGVAKAALSVALVSPDAAQMSLLITDDVTVQTLNHRFRGLNEVTDVLSFSTVYPGHWEGDDAGGVELPGGIELQSDDAQDEPSAFDFVMPPGEPEPLGELIVSYPQMRRQAEARGIPLERELALLIVHGVLHLIGHDHVESEEAAEMQSKEQAALRSLQLVEGQSP